MVTHVIPDTPENLEDALNDPNVLRELQQDPAKLAEFMRKYTKNVYERDPELRKQLAEAVSEGMKEGVKALYERAGIEGPEVTRGRLPMDAGLTSGKSGGSAIYDHLELNRAQRRQIAATGKGPGVPLVGQWPSMADYLTDIHPKTVQSKGVPAVLKDMSEGIGGDGGFLVPEDFRAEVLSVALESAVIRPRARVIPMGGPSVKIPAIRDSSHLTTVYGGVNVLWVAEGGSVATVTQPTFSQVQLVARQLTGYTVASNELLADSAVSLEAIINELFGNALAFFEDDSFIQGTGVGQPLGILNADALISVPKETGQAATTLVLQNIIKMYARLLPASHGRAVWLMHPDVMPQLMQLALNVGTGGSAVWMVNAASGPALTILGRPIIFTEKCKTLGTAGDIYYVDLGYYLIGDRQSLSMSVSPWENWITNEMSWKFIQRVDGRPWIQSALTPRNGSNTMSPFVSLATRA